MVRATSNQTLSFSDGPNAEMQDCAVLAGARSRGDRLFVSGAAGIAFASSNDGGSAIGSSNSNRHLLPAFDLSAHANRRIIGVALSVSGVLGSAENRYVTISLGAELGRFGP
jgi:hypothetical protein